MKKIDLKKMLGLLGFVLRCPVCTVQYNLSNIKVMDSEHDDVAAETRLLIHSDCQKCKSSVMFSIDINGTDIFTIMAMTDLTSADNTKFSTLEAIDINDCISVHESLRKFDGNFVKVFKKLA